jgi:hypothetical protein
MEMTDLKDRLSGKTQVQQPESTTDNIIPVSTTALTPHNSDYIALTSDAIGIISENLKHQQLSAALFDVIKAPAGGVTSFTIPGIGGDAMEKELTGIIIDYGTPRAYWDTPDPVEGAPPVCFSHNSVISHDGKPCNQCVFNEFGSKDNGDGLGKACKESVAVYLLRPDNILPLVVRVPVSSKMAYMRYVTRLISSMTPLSGVVTRITLEKATNKTGQPYATYIFEAVKRLSPEETAGVQAFGQKFKEILSAADVEPIIAEAV